jgi:hypothetical protein
MPISGYERLDRAFWPFFLILTELPVPFSDFFEPEELN